MTGKIRMATDIGGTFTDLVYHEVDSHTGSPRAVRTAKIHTTPPDFEAGVMDLLVKEDVEVSDIEFFAHGTTVVINALTERKGVRTGLITTRGFRDVLEIGRGNRPDFFNLRYSKPAPFVPRFLRQEITERVTHTGNVHTPVALDELEAIIDMFRKEGVAAVAICLLHAYANPVHEQALETRIRQAWPEVAVAVSHRITREWREYERTSTTVLSAYVQPIADHYLDRLERRLADEDFTGAFYIMQSNGGIDTIESARSTPITMVESGPASGVLGAAVLGKLIDEPNVIALDIGGTTAKCSLIAADQVLVTSQYRIERSSTSAGYPVMTPVVDIVEIGNGGGSIAWIDGDDRLRVGPKSAGALPGPVAYSLGGTEPTTTDAHLLTGRIDPGYFFGGEIDADMEAVRGSFNRLGARLELTAVEAARGAIRIANHNMINALKLVSINRGHDPRDFTIVAFGGAGAMHATALAAELNVPKVIVPANSAVFSAWGMLMSDLRRDYVRTRPTVLSSSASGEMSAVLGEMEAVAASEFAEDGISLDRLRFERTADMRYDGQEHTVRVALPAGKIDGRAIGGIIASFHENYENEYTYRLENEVQLVSYRLVTFGQVDQPAPERIPASRGVRGKSLKGHREVDFDAQGIHRATIWDRRRLEPGECFQGPAIVEEPASTTVVFPGHTVEVDGYGNLHVRLGNGDRG